jgi:hypothetical protein
MKPAAYGLVSDWMVPRRPTLRGRLHHALESPDLLIAAHCGRRHGGVFQRWFFAINQRVERGVKRGCLVEPNRRVSLCFRFSVGLSLGISRSLKGDGRSEVGG